MSETMKKIIVGFIVFLVFAVSMLLIILGQKNIGAPGLGVMMIGLAGLISLLWFYNRKFK